MQARAGMPCEFRVCDSLILEGDRTVPDFYWPEARVIVEIDGWEHHHDRRTSTRDKQKDRQRIRCGLIPLRFAATEILGGCAEGMVRELFETVGWSYPEVLEPAPDVDLTRPLPAPQHVQPRGKVTEKTGASTVNIRKRRWST